MIKNNTQKLVFLVLLALLPLMFLLNLMVGSVSIGMVDLWKTIMGASESEAYHLIFWESRLPKAITAMLCGAALSVSGLLMQTLFRNPLAGPYILGVSSGAGLGVAILVMGVGVFGITLSSSISIPLASIIGSILVLLILFMVSLRLKDVMTLLILGIMIGAIATAIVGIIQYFTTDFQLKSFLIWTLGSLEGLSYGELVFLSSIIVVGLLLALLINKPLNALLLGDNYAKSLGVNLKQYRLLIILLSGLLAGAITAYCGPIGFVGIIVPHLCRLLLKSSDHKLLIPAAVILGAEVLLLSDVLSNLPADNIQLPINSITSLIGVPIILWIIFNRQSISKSF